MNKDIGQTVLSPTHLHMGNLIVITPTWTPKGQCYIVDETSPLVQVLITEPLEDGMQPEYIRLLPEDEMKILADFAGPQDFIYTSPATDDWYIKKLIY